MTQASDSSSQDSHHALWADAALFSVALIWGVNIPLMKICFAPQEPTGSGFSGFGLDEFVFNAVRLVIASATLAAFAWREHRSAKNPPPGISWRQTLIYAALVSVSYQALFLLGIARTTSGNTALIITTIPMWTALLAHIFLRETLRRLAWLGLAIAMAGTAIVALQKGDVTADQQHLWGNLLVLAAALFWSCGTVYSRRLLTSVTPLRLSATAAVLGLPVHLLLAAGRYQENLPKLSSVSLWLIIVYSGVFSTGLALPMWNLGVRRAGAAHAAIFQNLVPLFAIFSAWVVLGEAATLAQWCGGALILSGLVMMRWKRA